MKKLILSCQSLALCFGVCIVSVEFLGCNDDGDTSVTEPTAGSCLSEPGFESASVSELCDASAPSSSLAIADDVINPGDDVRPDTCGSDKHFNVLLSGRIVRDGAPVPGGVIQVCSVRSEEDILCLIPKLADASGEFSLTLALDGNGGRCNDRLKLRAYDVNTPGASTFYSMLESDDIEVALGDLPLNEGEAPSLHPKLCDEGDSRSVDFDSGLGLDIIPANVEFLTGALDKCLGYSGLSAREVSPAMQNGLFYYDDISPDTLWAFSPEIDVLSDSIPIHFPNTINAGGSDVVEVYVYGGVKTTLSDNTLMDQGKWAMVGEASLNEDGLIDLPEGLPSLSWVALKIRE